MEAGPLDDRAHPVVAGVLHGHGVRGAVEQGQQVLHARLGAALDDDLAWGAVDVALGGDAPGDGHAQGLLAEGVVVGVTAGAFHRQQHVVGDGAPGECREGARFQVAVGEVVAGPPRRRPQQHGAGGGGGRGLQVGHVLHHVPAARPAFHVALLGEQVVGLLHGVAGAAEVAGEPPDGGELRPCGPRAVLDVGPQLVEELLVEGDVAVVVQVHGASLSFPDLEA